MADLIAFDEAVERLTDGVGLMSREDVSLGDAVGRILSEKVVPDRAQPPLAASAMDGYAVKLDAGKTDYHLVGEVAAGDIHEGGIKPGEAVRIFTGAPMPHGTDTVIIQENATVIGEMVHFSELPSPGASVRKAGIDFEAGAPLLSPGRRLTPMDIALAAAANRSRLNVYRQPVVSVFSTGNELVEPGRPLSDTSIVNSGTYGVSALVRTFGGRPDGRPILSDDEEAISSALELARERSDIIVTIGGASVGDYDLVKPAISKLGAEFVFEKVAVRPGKPTWHARFDGGPLVLGLPGNPASGSVCAYLFLAPLISAMMGEWRGEHDWVQAELVEPVSPNGPRASFLRGRLWQEQGRLMAATSSRQDSSLLTPLAEGNALIYRAPEAEAEDAGALAYILPFGPFWPMPGLLSRS